MLKSKKAAKWHHLCTLCNVIIKVIINVDYHDVNLSDILMVDKKAAINFQHFTLLAVLQMATLMMMIMLIVFKLSSFFA